MRSNINIGVGRMPHFTKNLYRNGEAGDFWESNDTTTLFSDAAGTVPAVVGGDVKFVRGQLGRYNLVWTGVGAPTLRKANGKYYLEFNGVDDQLEVPASTAAFKFLHDGTGGTGWAIAANLAGPTNPKLLGTCDVNGANGFVIQKFGFGTSTTIRGSSATVINGNSFPGVTDWPENQVSIISVGYKQDVGDDAQVYLDGAQSLTIEQANPPNPVNSTANLTTPVTAATGMLIKWFGMGVISRKLSAAEQNGQHFIYNHDLNFLVNMEDTDGTMEASITYGQSWVCQQVVPSDPLWLGGPNADVSLDMPTKAFILKHSTGRALRAIGANFEAADISDFMGSTPEQTDILKGGGINVGRLQQVARRLLKERASQTPYRTQVDINHGWPSQTWETLKPGGVTYFEYPEGVFTANYPWANGMSMISTLRVLAPKYSKALKFTHVNWIDAEADFLDLEELFNTYDGLNLNSGTFPILMFTDVTPLPGTATTELADIAINQIGFADAHPGRVFLCGPRYPYPYGDHIHHSAYGNLKLAESRARAVWAKLDNGVNWEPLRPTAFAIEAGNKIRITYNDPEATGTLVFDTTFIEASPQMGYALKRAGADIAITNVAIAGLGIVLTCADTPQAGDKLSYAWEQLGPDLPAGTHSDAWGNVKQVGPASVFWDADTIDAWALNFLRIL